jgi:hypothetical protein
MVTVSVAGGVGIRHMFPGIYDSEEELFVRAVVRLADGTIVRAASDPFYLPNLARVAVMDACERRGGRWDGCYNMASIPAAQSVPPMRARRAATGSSAKGYACLTGTNAMMPTTDDLCVGR